MTKDAIPENRSVRTVEQTVTIAEFAKTLQKCIFSMAVGKLLVTNPFLGPTRASGNRLISAFALKTFSNAIRNGNINAINRTRRTIHMTTFIIFLRRAAFAFSSSYITHSPPPYVRYKPA